MAEAVTLVREYTVSDLAGLRINPDTLGLLWDPHPQCSTLLGLPPADTKSLVY